MRSFPRALRLPIRYTGPVSVDPAPPDHRVDLALLGLVALLAMVPFWLPSYLPLMDLPQHLGVVADLAARSELPFLQERYSVHLVPNSNVLLHLMAWPMVGLFGPLGAVRIVLSLGAFAWIGGTAFLAHASGARPAAAVLALPLMFSEPLADGYLNYWLAWPAIFTAWGLLFGPFNRARLAAFSLLAMLAFLAHVQVWGFLLVTAPLLAAWNGASFPVPSRGRALGMALLGLLPSTAYAAAWAVASFTSNAAGDWLDEKGTIRWVEPLDWLFGFRFHTLALGWAGFVEGAAFFTFFLALGLAVLKAVLRRRLSPVLGLGLAALLASLVLPEHARNQYFIASRMVAPAMVLVALGFVRTATVPAIAAGMLACFVQLGSVSYAWYRSSGEAVGLREVLADLPSDATLVALMPDRSAAFTRGSVFLHAAAWHQALNHGRPGFSFTYFQSSPLRMRDRSAPSVLKPGKETQPGCALMKGKLPEYDYYLFRDKRDLCGVGEALDGHAEPVRKDGDWALFRRTGRIPKWTKPEACGCK